MSDQLSKPLTGQYVFLKEADRLATLKNLGVGGSVVALTEATTVDIDWSLGSHFYIEVIGAVTFTFSNQTEKEIVLVIASGDSAATITYPAAVLWAGAAEPADPDEDLAAVIRFISVNGVDYGISHGVTFA